MKFSGFAATGPKDFTGIKKVTYEPKPFGDYDIDIKIEACGVCGSDCLTLSGEWGDYNTPLVVGHEIVGDVVAVGPKAKTGLKVGDRVGVGAQSFACLECKVCEKHHENYCPDQVDTYNGYYKDGVQSQGGYASHVRTHEHFVFKIPPQLASELAAPLMCAGITTYAPLKQFLDLQTEKTGLKVGVVGLGGLGHIAVMFAKKMGFEVHVFSRGDLKKADALKMGADFYHDSSSPDMGKDIRFELDLILSTANVSSIPLAGYLSTLKVFGKFITLGLPPHPFSLKAFDLLANGVSLGSSHLGNREEMIEMLQFASDHGIKPWVEKLPISKDNVEKGLQNTSKSKCRYRLVFINFEKEFE